MKLNKAIRLLHDCEQGLRRLVAEAAAEGDYGCVQRIAEFAKAVGALVAESQPASEASQAASTAGGGGTGKTRQAGPESTATAGRGRTRAISETYPRFFRRGNELVKVGWSKKERKEYTHRASRRAIDAVSAAVRQLGSNSRLFTGDKLLPLKDPVDGSPLADYQAYVALAWLKHLGIVEQHGRKAGYSLVPNKHVEGTITAGWQGLAEWRG
ncbi:MAG TPA: hypothetical protein PK184_20605 [Phycisphaerae bacterium]|nr:hypothetical protein [Phycisphaerae bacterium]HPP29232.1 hypothetical protein [Phycisphaerae bacterium]HPU35103.1 hypothetical protein [Phycisphaerae bacterium]